MRLLLNAAVKLADHPRTDLLPPHKANKHINLSHHLQYITSGHQIQEQNLYHCHLATDLTVVHTSDLFDINQCWQDTVHLQPSAGPSWPPLKELVLPSLPPTTQVASAFPSISTGVVRLSADLYFHFPLPSLLSLAQSIVID